MKWSEGRVGRGVYTLVPVWVIMALGALGVGVLRPRLAASFHQVRVTQDLYALPSPEQTVVLSLGYRAALADLLWAHVLVSYGMHFQEKRRFEYVGNYLDTINALDPKFGEPYRLADTLLTLQPEKARSEDYTKARQVLERGMAELPYFTELWLTAGQFMSYLAPPRFEDPQVKEEWRMEGARRLARACELVGSNQHQPHHCITAAGLFTRAGDREATRRFAERVLAVSEEPSIREMALAYLKTVATEQERDKLERRDKQFQALWGNLGFVPKALLLVIGPPQTAARCAGPQAFGHSECASSWRLWGETWREESSQ